MQNFNMGLPVNEHVWKVWENPYPVDSAIYLCEIVKNSKRFE